MEELGITVCWDRVCPKEGRMCVLAADVPDKALVTHSLLP